MAKLKVNNTPKQEPPKKGKPSLIGMVVDAVRNPNKYYKPTEVRNDVPKPKPTKTFNVNNPSIYKDRAKRYNDSLTNYNKGQIERATTKKNVIASVAKYNKNKSFYEPEVEYAGENSLYGNTYRHEVRHKKSANSYAKLWTSSAKALRTDDKGNYVKNEFSVYPKPEYKPVYSPKKSKSAVVSKPKVTSSKTTSSKPTAKSTNTFSVKKTSMANTTASKPTVKPVIKDTIASKPVVAKAVVKPTTKNIVAPKPAQNIPKIKSSNNYGDTGTVSRGSYIETKTKMAPKKGPSTFKTVKKNYK